MAITQNSYTGNGSTTLYSFTFPYLNESDVKVTLNGTPTTAYTFANATTIQFTTAPGAGVAIRIYRETDDSSPVSVFSPGSSIKATDLNEGFEQSLYIAQETSNKAIDKNNPQILGNLDFNNFKGINLAAPTAGGDATNKAYVDAYINTTYQGPLAADPVTRTGGSPLQEGDLYFNTVEDILKAWTGTQWVISAAAGNIVRWRKTAVGGETSLSGNDDNAQPLSYVVGNEQVFINGALQTRGIDYTAGTGNSINGLVALTAGDVVELHAVQGYVSATLPEGSIGTSKIADGAVTSNKIADGTIVDVDVNSTAGIQATKLAFTQAGAGAVARTVDSKLKDVVSVKDFGAVGNGTTDDTAAIQAAIDSGAGCVFFPKGTYKITSQLQLRSYLRLQGEHMMHSILLATNANNILYGGSSPASVFYDVEIGHLGFRAQGSGCKGIGIDANFDSIWATWYIHDCDFYAELEECIQGCIIYCRIERNQFGFNGTPAANKHRQLHFKNGAAAGEPININVISHNKFKRATGAGAGTGAVMIEDGFVLEMIGNSFEQATCVPLYLKGIFNFALNHSWFEANTGTHLVDISKVSTGSQNFSNVSEVNQNWFSFSSNNQSIFYLEDRFAQIGEFTGNGGNFLGTSNPGVTQFVTRVGTQGNPTVEDTARRNTGILRATNNSFSNSAFFNRAAIQTLSSDPGTTSWGAFLGNRSASADTAVGIAMQATGFDPLDSSTNFTRIAGLKSVISGASENGNDLVLFTNANGSNATDKWRLHGNGDLAQLVDTSTIIQGNGGINAIGTSVDQKTYDALEINSSRSTTGTAVHVNFRNPNGIVGYISTNGSATSYVTSSDYRLKENVVSVSDGILRLKQLKPIRFNFIADPGQTVDGFLAHEAQAVVPECVTGEKDAVDTDGNPVYQGIDQSKLVPLLTAALQEAVSRIEILEAQVAELT